MFGASPYFWLLGGSLCLLLAATSVLTGTDPEWRPSFLLGTVFFAGFGSIALYLGFRLRAARKLLAQWPHPPGAPPPAELGGEAALGGGVERHRVEEPGTFGQGTEQRDTGHHG